MIQSECPTVKRERDFSIQYKVFYLNIYGFSDHVTVAALIHERPNIA